MSRAYQTTGINLKAAPLGESDRLLTILTLEEGLLRAVAPGARKHKSRLAGRSALFVVNQLLVIPGKSLSKVTQAETLRSFPGLSGSLAKLTASQYLAELTLSQAIAGQAQPDLYYLLLEHLDRLEQAPPAAILAVLAHATFHLLALAGLAPQVHHCCLSREPIRPNLSDPAWQVGFSVIAGGTVNLAALDPMGPGRDSSLREGSAGYRAGAGYGKGAIATATPLTLKLSAAEVALMQQLSQPKLLLLDALSPNLRDRAIGGETQLLWSRLERVLRRYAQYHLDRPIKSAALIDACFPPAPSS